jgi:molybdopterin-guanine dinucleotide biosynthesis protein A
MPSAATIAILSGGRAARFGGRDKSALVVGGRSIRDRQLLEFSPLSDDVLLVGAAPNGEDRRATPGGVRHVADRIAGRGPLAGLDAAFDAAIHDAVAVVACDMPFVTAAFVRFLLSLAGEADVVVPRTERGYHPLCAVYTRACQAPVNRRLTEGRLTMTGLFEDVRVHVVAETDMSAFGDCARLLANVNTPADYERIEALTGHNL